MKGERMQVIVIEPTRKKKYRVAAYCRISTEKTSQMESMENQYSAYLQKIQSHPEWEFAGIYHTADSTVYDMCFYCKNTIKI